MPVTRLLYALDIEDRSGHDGGGQAGGRRMVAANPADNRILRWDPVPTDSDVAVSTRTGFRERPGRRSNGLRPYQR